MKTNRKSMIGMLIAIVLIVMTAVLPVPADLSRQGLLAIGIFLAAVVLWIAETFPNSVTGLGLSMLMVLCGVYTINDAYRTFAGTAFFFVFATYAINAALAETSIPDRISAFFIKVTKNNSRLFVFGIMLSAALLSAIMSNMATCALLATLSLKLLKINGDPKPGSTNLGKCLMIGIPLACGAGGFATPAGTPANIIAINLLEENLGVHISFLSWMIVGIPVMLISLIVGAFAVTTIFKPEALTKETIDYANGLNDRLGKLTSKEKKVLIIIAIEMILWVLSTWVPILNTTLVAILAMMLMFAPGIDVLTWKTYDKYANYDSLFMMGSITALVGGLSASGATEWIVNTLIPDLSATKAVIVFLICSLLVAVIHMLIPAGSAVLTLAAVPMIGIAKATGISGAALMLIASFWAGASFLLPFDGVPLLTYGYGYYKMGDYAKTGIPMYIILIPAIALVIPLLASII